MENGIGSLVQKVIVFGSIGFFLWVFAPQLNDARKVYQVVREVKLSKAKFTNGKEAAAAIQEKLKVKGVVLPPDSVSAAGSGENMEISVDFEQLVKVNKTYDIEIAWAF